MNQGEKDNIAKALTILSDEYQELHERCVFFHDAVVALAEADTDLSHYSVNGLRHHSRGIKEQLTTFAESLEAIRQQITSTDN